MHSKLIFVSGPVGAGKSTLSQRLADRLGYEFLYDEFEKNPHLPQSYRGEDVAYLNQLWFIDRNDLRYRRALALLEKPEVKGVVFDKPPFQTRTFVELAPLSSEQRDICREYINRQVASMHRGDLLINLSGSPQTLVNRVHTRGRLFELSIDEAWFQRFLSVHSEQMLRWPQIPSIAVNIDTDDLFDATTFNSLVLRVTEALSLL